MVDYRRNINCLTTNQLHDLRETLAILYQLPASSPNSFLTIAGIHGMPAPVWCIHGAPGFFSWHRAYMLEYERALQWLNPDVHLPFWNWSSGPTTGVPAACSQPTYVNRNGDTVPNPLFAGPLPAGGPGMMTSRRADIDTTSFGDLAATAQTALGNSDFVSFQNALNSVHGSVHGRVGGDMSSVPYAGFDPIFFLHHANVDRLWAQWQASHPGALPPNEAGLSLEPFVKPCTDVYYTGSDMESTQALGYAYSNFCIIFVGPIVLKPIRLKSEPWWRERLSAAHLVVRASHMQAASFDLRVFLNDPEANEKTPIGEHPGYAGAFGIFGMGMAPESRKKGQADSIMPARAERFDMELDITAALKAALKQKKEPTITLVPVDPKGKALPAKALDFDGLDLHVA